MPAKKARAGDLHKKHSKIPMPNVKIKRVKRPQRKISTKEKILAGLGLGSSLLGGAGAVSAKQAQTQFVRTVDNESQNKGAGSKIKNVLSQIFGVQTAKADFNANENAYLPNAASGSQNLPYQLSTSTDGSNTVTLPSGATATYTSQTDLANQLSALNQRSGSLTPEEQQLQSALTNQFYGQYYNNSDSVKAAQDPNEFVNVYDAKNGITNTVNPNASAGAKEVRDANGNLIGVTNNVGGRVSFSQIQGGALTAPVYFADDAAATKYLNNLGIQGTYSSATGGMAPIVTPVATPPATGIQVSGVVGIYNEDQQLTAVQGNYNGQRYAIVDNGDGTYRIYDGSGQLTTAISQDVARAIFAANAPYAIITDADGNPLSVWDQTGHTVTDTTLLNTILTSYNNGTVLKTQSPAGPITPETPAANTLTPQEVLDAINKNDSNFLNFWLQNQNIGINSDLSANPQVNAALHAYMLAHNLTTGFAQGSLGQLILAGNPSNTVNVTPGQFSPWFDTEGVSAAYKNATQPFTLTTTKNSSGQVASYTFTINANGQNITRTFTPQELNAFLDRTWNGGQFLGDSFADQAVFVAAVQARIQDPNIGLGVTRLPAANTNDVQHVHYIDNNGNLVDIKQGFDPSGQSFMSDAQWLQKLFPGSTIRDAGYPGGTTGSWEPIADPNDPRGNYELVLPNGTRLNVGLFLQSGVHNSNGLTFVDLSAGDAKYFTPTNSNIVLENTSVTTGVSSQTPSTNTQAPVIATTSLQNGLVGTAYTQQLTATASGAAWLVSSGALPSGLSLNASTGVISGTPTSVGTFNFTIKAQNNIGLSAGKDLSIKISAAGATNDGNTNNPGRPTINAITLNGATVGQFYSATLSGSNVSLWSASGLPSWLNLNARTGVLSGTPTTAGGAIHLVITATGTDGSTTTSNLSIPIVNPAAGGLSGITLYVSQSSLTLPVGANQTVSAHVDSGDAVLVGSGKMTSATSNSAVATAVVSSDSNSVLIRGVSAGTAVITLHPVGRSDSGQDKTITVTVTAQSSSGAGDNGSGAADGSHISPGSQMSYSGATDMGPATIVSSSIFGASGFSGTNSGSGSGTTGSTSGSGSGYVAPVSTQTSIVTTSIPAGRVGQAYSAKLVAICSTSNIASWALASGQLPLGVTLASDGTLSGTPTLSGTFIFTAKAVDRTNGATDQRQFTLVVATANGQVPSVSNVGSDGSLVETDESGSQSISSVSNVGSDGSGLDGVIENTEDGSTTTISSVSNVGNDGSSDNAFEGTEDSGTTTAVTGGGGASSGGGGGSVVTFGLNNGAGINNASNNYQNFQGLKYQAPVQGAATASSATTYTVKKGDTLWGISKMFYGDGKQWRTIMEANLDKVQNPRAMKVGITLVIPASTTSAASATTFSRTPLPAVLSRASGVPASGTYTIQKGDTLSQLAQQFYGDSSKWTVLSDANAGKFTDEYHLKVGTLLNVPALGQAQKQSTSFPLKQSSISTFSRANASTAPAANPVSARSSSQNSNVIYKPSVTNVASDGEVEASE